jgi:hypothetical protein
MNIVDSKVIKTEKQEEIDKDGNIITYVKLHLPATERNNALLFSKNIYVIAHTQREGLAKPMEL